MQKVFSTAIINAGGKSLRMGTDKAFIKLSGKTLLDIIIANVRLCFDEVILVVNEPNKYCGYRDITIVEDCIKGVGPIAGLYTGLREAHSEYCFFIACDMPLINYEYIEYMKMEISTHGYDAIITQRQKGIEPFHGFYSTKLVDRIAKNIDEGVRSFYSLLQGGNTLFIPEEIAARYDERLNFFTNINTREDMNLLTGGL